jgi:hypothetical protein
VGGFDDYALADGPAVGPTGAVSWARHVATGRAVAVTELAESVAADQVFVGRLRATAAALAKIDQPNVLPIREVIEGEVPGAGVRVWVVEDWLEGRELGEVLGDGRLTAEQSVALTRGVLRGLTAVHGKGVVHGDVSTASIVIAAGGYPRLVGFGFAGMPGRPPADAAADVLAVATVLRDLLAGGARHPKLEAVVARATSDRPKDRPKNAAALLAMVEKAARSDFGKGWVPKPSLAQRAFPPPAAGTDEILSAATELLVGLLATPAAEPAAVDAEAGDPKADAAEPEAEAAAAEPADAAGPDDAPEAEPEAVSGGSTEAAAPDEGVVERAGDAESTGELASAPAATEPAETTADTTVDAEQPPPPPADPTQPLRQPLPPAPSPTPAPPVKPVAKPAAAAKAAPAATKKSKKARNKKPRSAPAPTAPAVPVASEPPPAPAPPAVPTPSGRGRKGAGRRPQSPPVVRGLAGIIMILLGAALAITVERHQTTETSSGPARGGPTVSKGPLGAEVASPAQIAASDITGAWTMRLAVFESTGFFGTQVGQSVEKTYTIRSDCTALPCVLKLVVSGTPGEFDLRRQPDEYVLAASGPQDCIELSTGALKVPNGGVASVSVHLRPTSASRTPRGDWAATGIAGSVVTTFDTTNPGCPQGSGVQRSTAVGTRQ